MPQSGTEWLNALTSGAGGIGGRVHAFSLCNRHFRTARPGLNQAEMAFTLVGGQDRKRRP